MGANEGKGRSGERKHTGVIEKTGGGRSETSETSVVMHCKHGTRGMMGEA